MSIKAVHLFFICLAVLISAVFGWWSLKFDVEGQYHELLGIVSLILAAGLVVYGFNFYKKMKSL